MTIFGGAFLAAALLVPFRATHVSLSRDRQTNLVWQRTAGERGYMFLFRYLKRSGERLADAADRDVRATLRRTGTVTSSRYRLNAGLLAFELAAIGFLAAYDYLYLCRRRRRSLQKSRPDLQGGTRVTRARIPVLFLFPLLTACAAHRAFAPPPMTEEASPRPVPPFDLAGKMTEAGALAERGGYVHLCRAFAVYQEIEGAVPDRSRYAVDYAETALLLAARAKDLAIRNDVYIAKARGLIHGHPSLTALAPALEAVAALPVKSVGIWDDGPARDEAPGQGPAAKGPPGPDLTAGPDAGPFTAYILALQRELAGQGAAAKAGLDQALNRHPGSFLLRYARAAMPPADGRLLSEISERDPESYEADLGLGQLALAAGSLITAEKHLLRAHEGVPGSPLIAILLASVNFGTEEYDRGLAFYGETLEVAPAYKEALLGKAICLSCLGRPDEAIPILEDLLARGPALEGETRFWLAADLHEIGDAERAAAEIEKAKALLPVARVFTLAGTIALERGELGSAERDLKRAVNLDSGESEAFFALGKLYARRSVWPDAALNFSLAGYGFEADEEEVRSKIGLIEGSAMAGERKARLLARKRLQIEKIRLSKATARFNAAAGYFNSRDLDNALTWAQRAAEHPYFAEKARKFAALISSGKKG